MTAKWIKTPEKLAALKELEMAVKMIDLRIAINESEFNKAVEAGTWSHVAGLHGIGTGLMIAKKQVEDCMNEVRYRDGNVTLTVNSARKGQRKVRPVGESI